MTAGRDDDSKPTSSERLGRKIQFHGRVQFKNIRHVSEFSEDEIKNGWYDKDDFNRMSDDVAEIAKMVGEGLKHRNGEYLCIRGLEHIVEEELANFRAEKMINSIDAVLDEQEEQWDEGIDEPETIAELYTEYAKSLAEEAHQIGLRDAEEGYKSFDLADLIHNNNTHCSGGGTTTEIEEEEEKPISISSLQSLSSSSHSLRNGGSSSSIASLPLCGLKEAPDKNENGEKKNKHQRKTQPRRTMLDRKNGSELSPFVFRRDGTLMFRKSDVEKLKREQSEKRRNCIHGSLNKFLADDDEEEDYLAGLLSKKKPSVSVSSRLRI
jgi:hypothetical protein